MNFLKDLFFHDFFLKLFSLGLAILIWLTVAFAIKKEGSPVPALTLRPEEQRTFSEVPVFVTFTPKEVRNIKISTNHVEVTLQGDSRIMRGLQAKDIRATVDLAGIEAAQELRKRIEVSTLAGILIVKVVPAEVQVSYPPSE